MCENLSALQFCRVAIVNRILRFLRHGVNDLDDVVFGYLFVLLWLRLRIQDM